MTKPMRGTLLLTTLILASAAVSFAAPFGLRLSFTDDLPTSMAVTWNTSVDTASEVWYGTSPGVLTSVATGTSTVAIGGLGYVHEVSVAEMAPATTYYYIAGSTADGFSSEHSFVTRATSNEECGSTRFAFLADSSPDPIMGGGDAYAQMLVQAAAHGPSFILHGGDMVTDGDEAADWVDFLNWTAPVAAEMPFMTSLGEHDVGPGVGDAALYNQLLALPRSAGPFGSGTEDYYYFTAGNAIFVVLSTDSFTGGAIAFADQAAWLDDVLTQNPRKWKFVVYHKPSYTYEDFFGVNHPPNEEQQNAALIPIIDAHHVDVVFSGHNHWYERYAPSACATQGHASSSQPCSVGGDPADGTVFIVSGGAASITTPSYLCGLQPNQLACTGDQHYLLVDIVDEVLTLETWTGFPLPNELIDTLTIVKLSSNCEALIFADGFESGDTSNWG